MARWMNTWSVKTYFNEWMINWMNEWSVPTVLNEWMIRWMNEWLDEWVCQPSWMNG